MKNEQVKWNHVFEATHGKRLSGPEVAAWEDEIRHRVNNVMASEVVAAARLCKSKNKFAPTVDDLIETIFLNKRKKANPHYGEGYHTLLLSDGDGSWSYHHEYASSWQERLQNAKDGEMAWNIICEPCLPSQCKEREEFCQRHGISYERFKGSLYDQINRTTRQLIGNVPF